MKYGKGTGDIGDCQMGELHELWTGAFGTEYTARNRTVEWDGREMAWRKLLPAGLDSILEVGANIGQNLQAISKITDAALSATEPNKYAREQLTDLDIKLQAVTADFADRLSFPDNAADLVFTSGVLIHIPADRLLQSMREIHRVAKRWIISMEYFAPTEEMVPYRGHRDALWRRDYGSIWLDNFPDLECCLYWFAWQRMTGLDNVTVWIFEKGHRSN